jgi:hypothetical protein
LVGFGVLGTMLQKYSRKISPQEFVIRMAAESDLRAFVSEKRFSGKHS